jgi:MoaA/NifB/PqqE/SkfB family radical SAM enzyme
METPSATFCSMAWDHQFVDPTGRVKPCCRFAERFRPPENNLNEQSLSDIFYGSFMTNMRQKMLRGERVDGCIRCYQEEDAGKRSLRQRYHDSKSLPIERLVNLEKPSIRWMELAISNDCNLACRMCDSRYSWKWFREEQKIFGQTFNTKEHSRSDISCIDPFLNDLVHLKFTGGEPLITKDQWRLIDKLLEQRDCSEIFLNYSTNCTIMPKPEWIEKWSRFKLVEFALSFDSADERESEYIRWPAKFEQTVEVTEKFLQLKRTHGFDVFLRTTVSLLNVWHLPETMHWWHQRDPGPAYVMNPTHLTFPEYLSVTVLPANLKAAITKKFEDHVSGCQVPQINETLRYIANYMNSKDDSHLVPKLREYLIATDGHRGQSFAESYPQFKDWDLIR